MIRDTPRSAGQLPPPYYNPIESMPTLPSSSGHTSCITERIARAVSLQTFLNAYRQCDGKGELNPEPLKHAMTSPRTSRTSGYREANIEAI